MLANQSGQSTIEALLAVLIITSTTSLMFHSAIQVSKYIIQEQLTAENLLIELSLLQINLR